MKGLGLAGGTARAFVDSRLTPLLMVATLLAGVYATVSTPREEQPTIEVPRASVLVAYPGAGPEAADLRVARPLASHIRQLEIVDDVESTATPDAVLLEVKFDSGLSQDRAFSALAEQIRAARQELPPGAAEPVIQMQGSEDLAVLAIVLSSAERSGAELHRLAVELSHRIEELPQVHGAQVIGGYRRELRVQLDPVRMAAHGVSPSDVTDALRAVNVSLPAADLQGPQGTLRLASGARLRSASDLGDVVIKTRSGPLPLRAVATVVDGPEEAGSYVTFATRDHGWRDELAVTIAVTNLRGTNVGTMTERVLARVRALEADLVPRDVRLSVVYDTGQKANEQVKIIVEHLLVAILIVLGIVTAGLGWRAGAGIAIVIPLTLAAVPVVYWAAGMTLNEISISAMIFAIGILSDDAVVIMENVARYFEATGRRTKEVVVRAVDEVGNPTILATLTILAALMPTAFITGEMGQYSRALPVGASAAMAFSLLVALSITPYLALRMLRPKGAPAAKGDTAAAEGEEPEVGEERVPPRLYAFYRRLLLPFLHRPLWRWGLYAGSVLLLVAAMSLLLLRIVPVTLLLDKDSPTLVFALELPEDATLERTAAAAGSVVAALQAAPELAGYSIYAGTPGPTIYAGLPRGPEAEGPNRAEIHVRLVPEGERRRASHRFVMDLRPTVLAALAPYDGRLLVKESPTGPATRAAVVAEVYARSPEQRVELASRVGEVFRGVDGLADVRVTPDPAAPGLWLEVDHAAAAARGVPTAALAAALRVSFAGENTGLADIATEPYPLPISVRLPRAQRASRDDLAAVYLPGADGASIPLADLVRVVEDPGARTVHRKNLLPVAYVSAQIGSADLEPLYAQLAIAEGVEELALEGEERPEVRWFADPSSSTGAAIHWAGEWEYTFEVYRDLALAGLAVVALIYMLLVAWFHSFVDPIIIMAPIPLVFVGVVPAHWLAGIAISGLGTIGVVALAGIVARNSILLVDFVRQRGAAGLELDEAVIRSAAVRTRPVVLTALTLIFGDGVLLLDPTLRGLGLTLATGAFVTTALTLMLIPVIYFHVHGRRRGPAGARAGSAARP